MRSINWRCVFVLGMLLAVVAAISLVVGLILYFELQQTQDAAALGWLLYFIPLNFLGGFIVGVAEGILFSWLCHKKSLKIAWVSVSILVILGSIANSYEVWTVGVITFMANIALIYFLQRKMCSIKTRA